MSTRQNLKTAGILLLVLHTVSSYGMEWIKNGNFEDGKVEPWHLEKPNKQVSLSIIKDSNLSGGGSGALGITMTDTPRINICQRLKVGPGTYKFTAYIDTTRCTKPRGYVLLYLSGSVGGKYKNFCSVSTPGNVRTGWKTKEWDKHELVVTVPPGGTIKSINILVGNITGTVMLDRISLRDYGKSEKQKDLRAAELAEELKAVQASAPQVEFGTRKDFNLFRHDETPELGFELKNPADRQASVQVQFTTTDYFGRTILKSEKEFKIPAKGKISEILRYPECRLPGFYCTRANWKSGGHSGKQLFSFVKVGPVPEKKDPLYGMTFYYDGDLKSLDKLDLLACGSKGVEFKWHWWLHLKPEAFDKMKKRLEEFRKRGIEPIGGFSMLHLGITKNYWNKRLSKRPPLSKAPELDDLRETMIEFVEKVVTLYKPYIKVWFLGGEVESQAQKYPSSLPDYIETIKFTSQTIRRMDPDAEVHGIGIGGFKSHPFFVFMPKVLPHVKDYIDGIAPDIYPAGNRYGKGYITLNTEENGFRSGLMKLVEMAKVTRKGYVSNAEGGSSIYRNTPLDDPCGISMANNHARQFILLKTVPGIRYWQYYKTTNNPKVAADWGMWEKDNPRQIVSAYAATARIMAFAVFVREMKLHQDIPCWMFRKDGKYFAAVWYNGKENLKVKLTDGIAAEAKDVQGNPIEIKDGIIYLGEAPIYLYAKDPTNLEKLLANASAGVSELEFVLDRQTAGKTLLAIKNKSGHKIDLTLKSAEIPGQKPIPYSDKITLASGEIKTIEKAVGADSVTFHLETGNGRKYAASAVLKPVKVPVVNSFAELEKKAVPQYLNLPDRQIVGYDDLKIHGLYTGLDDLSAVFRLGYDENFLYLEVRVKDDVHRNNSIPSQIYNADCIQFAIDANRDANLKKFRGIRGYSDDDFNFAAGLAKGSPCLRCYVAPANKRAKLLEKACRPTPEITRDKKTKTTLYRIKLAFSDLEPLKPERGRNFGFSLLVFDWDPPSEFYAIKYSAGVDHPWDPSKYPAFQFE